MKTHWIDRLAVAALTLAVVALTVQLSKDLWSGYRLAVYAVPTCQPPEPPSQRAMSDNPFGPEQ